MIRVRYKLLPTFLNLALGAGFLYMHFHFKALDPADPLPWVYLVLALIMPVGATAFLLRPAAFLEGETLVVPAVLGPLRRRYPVADLRVAGRALYAVDRGWTRRLASIRKMSRAADWSALLSAISAMEPKQNSTP